METKVLALCGKKQSGKNTTANWFYGIQLAMHPEIPIDGFQLKDNGRLQLIEGGTVVIDDFSCEDIEFNGAWDETRDLIYQTVRNYSFADALKKDVCIGILGLSFEQCFGTDEQKNTETHLKWENMPGVVTSKNLKTLGLKASDDAETIDAKCASLGLIFHAPGFMTAREVMQFVGTEIFRKMYGQVWVDSCIRKIMRDKPKYAIITDCRFPNEGDGVLDVGGKLLRLTRSVSEDSHPSEVAMDDYQKFSYTLDNSKMSVIEQCAALFPVLSEWGWWDGVGSHAV
jgi:hypothetical protein